MPGSGVAMCPHCEKFRGGLGGCPKSDYIDGLAVNRAYFLVLCRRCGAPWLGHGYEPHILRELTVEGVKEMFPNYRPAERGKGERGKSDAQD
jgi:hypothetical protein